MKKYLMLICFLIFANGVSLNANDNNVLEEFNKQLNSVGLEFFMPVKFKPTSVLENDDVLYYYAIKHKNKKVEIRYSIYPPEKHVSEPNKIKVGSDTYQKGFTYTVVVNIAGDDKNIESFKYMQDDMVKNKFNADIGYIAVVKPVSTYGKGYKKAMIVGLYKSGFGFSYHTILFNESKNEEDVLPQFYSIRFKDKK